MHDTLWHSCTPHLPEARRSAGVNNSFGSSKRYEDSRPAKHCASTAAELSDELGVLLSGQKKLSPAGHIVAHTRDENSRARSDSPTSRRLAPSLHVSNRYSHLRVNLRVTRAVPLTQANRQPNTVKRELSQETDVARPSI